MVLLWLGVIALFIGPLAVSALGHRPAVAHALDSFVVVAICGLVFLHILPEALAEAGWPVMAAVLAGSMLPTLLHGPLHAVAAPCKSSRSTQALLALAGLAVCLHAIFDGVALAPHGALPHGTADSVLHASMALAVVLHRLLEGTALWYLMRPHLGRGGSLAAMLGLALATIAGYAGAHWAALADSGAAIAWVQAGVAGSLLHVLAHHTPAAPCRKRWAQSLGLTAGAALLAGLSYLEASAEHDHEHHGHAVATFGASLLDSFVTLGIRVAPWVLVALCATALLHALAPTPFGRAAAAGTQQSSGAWAQALRGALRGLGTDVALARLAPLYDHARADTTPQSASRAHRVAFLCAAPASGVVAACVGWSCQGALGTLARFGVVAAWAAVAGWRLVRRGPSPDAAMPTPACAAGQPVARNRLLDGAHFALGEATDAVAPWLIFGLLLAAIVDQGVDANALGPWARGGWDVCLAGFVAAPLYIDPVAASLIGLVLWHKGMSTGAVVAYLLCSSGISVVGWRLLRRLYTPAAAALVTGGLFGLAVAIGMLSNALWGLQAPPPLTGEAWAAGTAAASLLALLVLQSCGRQGIRQFLAPITAWSMHLGRHHHH